MKKLMILLLMGVLSVTTTSFVPMSECDSVELADIAVTTCPSCHAQNSVFNTKTEFFTCLKCGCEWRNIDGVRVVIVAAPKNPQPFDPNL